MQGHHYCEDFSSAAKYNFHCRPGGCNLVMWQQGTPRLVLEIVLASVCRLALHSYLFSHCHCWTAARPRQASKPAKA